MERMIMRTMTVKEKIKHIEDAVKNALLKYDIENVDIMKINGAVDIIYHSRHNSFSIISNVCTSNGLSESDIDKIANYYDIGYCW